MASSSRTMATCLSPRGSPTGSPHQRIPMFAPAVAGNSRARRTPPKWASAASGFVVEPGMGCASAGRTPASVHVGVGAQVLEDLLPLLLVDQQVHALAVVPPLRPPLGLEEDRRVPLPVAVAAAAADLLQAVLLRLAEAL